MHLFSLPFLTLSKDVAHYIINYINGGKGLDGIGSAKHPPQINERSVAL